MSRWLSPLLGALLFSCGSQQDGPTATAAATDSAPVADDTAQVDETPAAEVCGMKVGEIFCDHTLTGYVRPGQTTGLATSETYGPHKITDVLSKSAVKYVYVFASAYW